LKKVVIHRPGGYRQLSVEQHPDLTPGPGEVLIDVSAIGVNFADCVTRMGLYASARHYVGYPITPGFEVSGLVAKCGPAVKDLEEGHAVIAVTRFNGYATQLCVDRSQVFTKPPDLPFDSAAALPTVSLTAWYALQQAAHVQAGETLLVHSAAGGVGSMLVQMGKILGCRVIAVVGATHKVAAARTLGADAVIDKSVESLWDEARRHAPDGYDVVLDANGITTLKHSYRQLAPRGRLVVYGFHGMLTTRNGLPGKLRLAWDYLRTPRFSPFDLTTRNRSVLGFNLSYLFEQNAMLVTGMQQILLWQADGRLVVPTVTAFPLESVAEAHRQLESGQTVGKLVLRAC
jgi:NADPH:quinone reductase-like Zn-dependent oxidoreductase